MTQFNRWDGSHVRPPSTQIQHDSATKPKSLGVFWDIENCNVPNGKSAVSVCEKIRRQPFCQGHREIQFSVVCDATKESKTILEELDKAQVDILHVASNRKNAADDKLKQLMRRFADLHRDDSRIVLISGDMDFAADIADFKRRMCLSVILLHSPNTSESLILAASEHYGFYDLLSSVPQKHNSVPQNTFASNQSQSCPDELYISNLPGIKDCTEGAIRHQLTCMSREHYGNVQRLTMSNGSAILKFPSGDQAQAFKKKFLYHKIGGRSINIMPHHQRGKSPYCLSRRKSFSQSPRPGHRARVRSRTISESGKKDQASSQEINVDRSSSRDSSESDVVLEASQTASEKQSGLEPKLNHLSVDNGGLFGTIRKQKQLTESSFVVDHSSTEEESNNRHRKPNSKFTSKLKLKNRKKSGATYEFLKKVESNCKESDDGKDQNVIINLTVMCCDMTNEQLKEMMTTELAQYQVNIISIEMSQQLNDTKVEVEVRSYSDAKKIIDIYEENSSLTTYLNSRYYLIAEFPNFIQDTIFKMIKLLEKVPENEMPLSSMIKIMLEKYSATVSVETIASASALSLIGQGMNQRIRLNNEVLNVQFENEDEIFSRVVQTLEKKPELCILISEIVNQMKQDHDTNISIDLLEKYCSRNATLKILDNKYLSFSKQQVFQKVTQNLSSLINTFPDQWIRIDLVYELYKERYQADLARMMVLHHVSGLCNLIKDHASSHLIILNCDMVPYISLRNGNFVQAFFRRVNDIIYNLKMKKNFASVPAPIFEEEYRKKYGHHSFIDLNLIRNEFSNGIQTSTEDEIFFFELTPLYVVGNEIQSLLESHGGVLKLKLMREKYHTFTGKSLSESAFGFENTEKLVEALDFFVKIIQQQRGEKNVVLPSINDQLMERMGRSSTERDNEPENIPQQNIESPFVQPSTLAPDILGGMPRSPQTDTVQYQSRTVELDETKRSTSTATVSPALRSLRQEKMFNSTTAGKLKLTSFVNQDKQASSVKHLEKTDHARDSASPLKLEPMLRSLSTLTISPESKTLKQEKRIKFEFPKPNKQISSVNTLEKYDKAKDSSISSTLRSFVPEKNMSSRQSSEEDLKCNPIYSSNSPGEIITIEDSTSDQEVDRSSRFKFRPEHRRKSRLAANFETRGNGNDCL